MASPASPSSTEGVSLQMTTTAAPVGVYDQTNEVTRMYQQEREALIEVNEGEKINLPLDVVETLARLSLFSAGTLTDMRMESTRYKATSERSIAELVNESDRAREAGLNKVAAQAASSTAPINNADELLAAYLSPGEQVVAQLPFQAIDLDWEDGSKSFNASPVERGSGRFVLTNQRVIVWVLDREIQADRLSRDSYMTSLNANHAMAKLQRERSELHSRMGMRRYIAQICPFFMGQAARDLREINLLIAREEARAPNLVRRRELTELLRLLKPSTCCPENCCSCACDGCCALVCCGSATYRTVVRVESSEEINVVPIPLDRLVYARLATNSMQSGATDVEADNNCLGYNCCACLPCAGIDVRAHPEREIKQVKPRKSAAVVLSLLMPPWNKRAHLRITVADSVSFSTLPPMLAQMQRLMANFNVQHIEEKNSGVRVAPTEAKMI